jgi:aminobenzoyl-glutamate transport protein
MTEVAMKSSGFLKSVERIGNAMPHPLGIFLGITGIVLVMSALLS